MKNEALITKIFDHIGGKENISDASHCITRLRLRLYANSKADIAALKALPGILGVVMANNQLQIVVGQEVSKLYAEMMRSEEIKDN